MAVQTISTEEVGSVIINGNRTEHEFDISSGKIIVGLTGGKGNNPLLDRLVNGKSGERLNVNADNFQQVLERELRNLGINLNQSELTNLSLALRAVADRYGVPLGRVLANFVGIIEQSRHEFGKELNSLTLGVFGNLQTFIAGNGQVNLFGTNLQIRQDNSGYYYIDQNGTKRYITTEGIIVYRDRNGRLVMEEVKDKSGLGSRYAKLKAEGIDEIYYIYSGDLVRESVRRTGVRVERLSSNPKDETVYHGKILVQVVDVKDRDGRIQTIELLTVRTTDGYKTWYRIRDPSDHTDRFSPGWMDLEESLKNPNSIINTARDFSGNPINRWLRQYNPGVWGLDMAKASALEARSNRLELPYTLALFADFFPLPSNISRQTTPRQQLEPKERTEYNLTVQHPEWGFRNQSIRVYVGGNAIEDASHLRITVGRNVFEIPKERLKKDENGNYYFEIGLDQSGPVLLRVDAYRENRMLSSYSGRINVLDDQTRVNATPSVRVEEGRSGRVDVNAEYRLYSTGSVNLGQNLGVYGVAEGKDGRFYLILPPDTKVNGEEPKTRVMSFESREELEKYLHENVIQTEFRQNGNNLYYRGTVEIPSDLARNIGRIQWFVNGTVNVNGINREVSSSADTNVVFIPRPQEAPKPRVQEQQLQEEKRQTEEIPEQERQREELKLTLQVPERIVSGSNQPIPVQMVHNGKEGFVFGVNSNDEIVLPNGRVVGRLEQFRDPITGLIDLDKLYGELSKYPEARNITQMYNPGSDFTVYGLTVGEDGEKKLVEQKVMAVPVEVSISGEGGSIRNGIVEKGATITFEYTKEATGIDPLVQLNIDGRSLETLVREGLVEIVENNPGKMVIRLTDRGMLELGKDGKLEVRYKAEDVGIQGAYGSVEIARELDLGVELFVNRATINAPELYIVYHRNGILAEGFNRGLIGIRIETNQMKDYNGDGEINEEDVREAIRKGHITIELAGAPVRVDFLRDIKLERDGDNYVISFNIADSDILGIALAERINLNRGATTMRIAIKDPDTGEIVASSDSTIGFVNIITHDLPSQIPYNIQVGTEKRREVDITQPGTRDYKVIEGIDKIENISELIQNFRLGSASVYPLENVRNLLRNIKIKDPGQDEPIQVLLGELGIDGFSLGDLIPLASKSMGQLTQEERVKLAIFALALHLNGEINNLDFYSPTGEGGVSADKMVRKLEELGILKYAHELLRALVGDMDDNTRRAEFDRLSNSIPDQLNAGQQYYSLLKAFLGKVSETEREVVVIETEIARFNIDRILWEKLSPEERIQLVLSLGVGISMISANVRTEEGTKDAFGVGVKPKLEFRVEYENGRVKIRGYGGVEGRYVIPVLDSEKLLSNMNYLNAYVGVLGNVIIFQNRDGSVEIYFGARADIRNVLGSGESPREIVVVGQAGLVSRLFYTEENGVGYYKIETRVGIDGRMIGTGELRLDRGTGYLKYNFNPYLGVGIGVNTGFNNGQFSVQTLFANITGILPETGIEFNGGIFRDITTGTTRGFISATFRW
ncbi:MAG: hypothetical protein QXD03_00065 [Candidatus Anstonellales archaeon]